MLDIIKLTVDELNQVKHLRYVERTSIGLVCDGQPVFSDLRHNISTHLAASCHNFAKATITYQNTA